MIVNEDGSVTGSIDRTALEALQKAEAGDEPPAEAEVKPSMALSKDELVNLAEQAGLGERDDLEQFTKQELVDELKASEGEG